jgi:hypothetical protein
MSLSKRLVRRQTVETDHKRIDNGGCVPHPHCVTIPLVCADELRMIQREANMTHLERGNYVIEALQGSNTAECFWYYVVQRRLQTRLLIL